MTLEQYTKFYKFQYQKKIHVPESFIARIFLSKIPVAFLDNYQLKGKLILDFSAGSGRHIEFFQKLKMKVYGTEISKLQVNVLKEKTKIKNIIVSDFRKKIIKFKKKFDYITVINSIYYEDESNIFKNLSQIREYLKTDGILVLSFVGKKHFILKDSIKKGNSYVVKNDKHGFRDKSKIYVVKDTHHLNSILKKSKLKIIEYGELLDKAKNYSRHLYYCTCKKL